MHALARLPPGVWYGSADVERRSVILKSDNYYLLLSTKVTRRASAISCLAGTTSWAYVSGKPHLSLSTSSKASKIMTHRNMMNGDQQHKSQRGNIIARIAELNCYDYRPALKHFLSLVPWLKVIHEFTYIYGRSRSHARRVQLRSYRPIWDPYI